MASEDEIVEALGSFTADLLSETRHQPLVRALLGAAPGAWLPVANLCALPDILARLATAFFVVVLAAPGVDADPAYRLIVFVCRDPWFHTVAVFNTAVVRRSRLTLHRGGPHP